MLSCKISSFFFSFSDVLIVFFFSSASSTIRINRKHVKELVKVNSLSLRCCFSSMLFKIIDLQFMLRNLKKKKINNIENYFSTCTKGSNIFSIFLIFFFIFGYLSVDLCRIQADTSFLKTSYFFFLV